MNSNNLLDGHWKIKSIKINKKLVFPLALALFIVIGLLSPLFSPLHIGPFPGMKIYSQHLFFDTIGDAGGFYAATFCKHWWHKVPIAVGFALATTYFLVTMVG